MFALDAAEQAVDVLIASQKINIFAGERRGAIYDQVSGFSPLQALIHFTWEQQQSRKRKFQNRKGRRAYHPRTAKRLSRHH